MKPRRQEPSSIATLVVVGLWSTLFPALRRIDRFADLEHTNDG